MMEVEVPAGYSAGETMPVLLPDGNQFDVVIPDGCSAGSMILVEQPSAHGEAPKATDDKVLVTVPEGVAPGSMFNVQAASGMLFEVCCPEGLAPGDVMEVELPTEVLHDAPSPGTAEGRARESPPASGTPTRTTEPPAAALPEDDGSSSASSPEQHPVPMTRGSVGTNAQRGSLADRFGRSSPQKQTFMGRSGGGGTSGRFGRFGMAGGGLRGHQILETRSGANSALEIIYCRSHTLREPQPEEGCRFFIGQAIQLHRSSGVWSEGTVMEVRARPWNSARHSPRLVPLTSSALNSTQQHSTALNSTH